MIRIERILCPTDLSLEADEALRYAVALTCAYEAKLFLLYCKEGQSDGNKNGDKIAGTPAPLFSQSLAPHLGLKTFCQLDWQGLVAENVDDVGKAIVDEARTRRSI